MVKKDKFIFIFLISIILYISISIYFFIDYSKSLDSYNLEIYDNLDSLQNLIHRVHLEDSELYKSLLSKNLLSSQIENSNQSLNINPKNILNGLLKLKYNSKISNSKIANTITNYYDLENLRDKIIELNKLKLLNNSYLINKEISNFLREYEKKINIILNEINKEIIINKIKNKTFIINLKNEFLIKEFILFFIFIISISLISVILGINKEFFYNILKYGNYSNINNYDDNNKKDISNYNDKNNKIEIFNGNNIKNLMGDKSSIGDNPKIDNSNVKILDLKSQEILKYIKNQIKFGNFPTIKEVKLSLEISHPTLLLKLNELEKHKLISIKKKGRNKYIFLK